tara:strand:- start:313 stop:819 length:507 start_codon:yes stop_codon:yes gene_type:complete
MSLFPAIVPNSIEYDFGEAQVSEYEAFGLGPVRFRHTNSIANQKFSLNYQGLSQESINLIREHYAVNSGTVSPFLVPVAVFGGIALLDASAFYRYEETPTEQHSGAGLYSVTISLRALKGVTLEFVLDGGNAQLPAEQLFNEYVFNGTAPFVLDGSAAGTATLVLKGK